MEYYKTISLKDGRECVLRNGTENDGQATLDVFVLTHRQTDYLLSYPDEIELTAEQQSEFLRNKTASDHEISILADVDGQVVGLAGIEAVGKYAKTRRRASFGVSIDETFWGLGVGRALTRACVESAKKAGYAQLELEVVADNHKAIALYESEGFVTFGQNPRGFFSRTSGWQELLLMRLEL